MRGNYAKPAPRGSVKGRICEFVGCDTPARCHVRGTGPWCAKHGMQADRNGTVPGNVYQRDRNPRPEIGFISNETCACGRKMLKPRYRVKAGSRRV